MFVILRKQDNEWIELNWSFSDPQKAQQEAKSLQDSTGATHKIKRTEDATDKRWQERETARFENGTYSLPDWNMLRLESMKQKFPLHFLHTSNDKTGKLAYTQTPEKGKADIQTRISAHDYLNQFYKDLLAPCEIKSMVQAVSFSRFEILTTTKSIVDMYVNGPSFNSCMRYSAEHFETDNIHPCSIYGGESSLKLAVLRQGDEIEARCLVWPEKGIHGRIYSNGSSDKMKEQLTNEKYHTDDFCGAKLNRLENSNGDIICAYLDGVTNIEDCGDYLKIDDGGNFSAENVNGLLEGGNHCHICEDNVSDDYTRHDDDGNTYCECCYSDNFSYCEACDSEHPVEDSHYHDDQVFCDDCFHAHHFECDDCGEYHHTDSLNTVDEMAICDTCIVNGEYFNCDDCGTWHKREDVNEIVESGEDICNECITNDRYIKCDDCGSWHYKDSSTRADAKNICAPCLDDYIECDLCGYHSKTTIEINEMDICNNCTPLFQENQTYSNLTEARI